MLTDTRKTQATLVPMVVTKAKMQQLRDLDARLSRGHYVKGSTMTYRFGAMGCVTYRMIHGRIVRKDWLWTECLNVTICDL
jgi:hypothetical protein